MRFRTGIVAGLLMMIVVAPALAVPIQWSGNGHYYEAIYVPGGITWQQAQDACVARGGYLATITSAEEHAFVFGLVSNAPEFWFIDGSGNGEGPLLGGYQPAGSPEPGGGWTWVTGEPFNYTAWSPGEPNNAGGDESRLVFFKAGGLIGDRWNDNPAGSALHGYIFEKNSCTSDFNWSQSPNSTTVMFHDLTPGATSWSWNFGDGATDNVQNPSHPFHVSPCHATTFTVSLTTGDCSPKSKQVPVSNEPAPGSAGTAYVIIGDTYPCTAPDLCQPGTDDEQYWNESTQAAINATIERYELSGYAVHVIGGVGGGVPKNGPGGMADALADDNNVRAIAFYGHGSYDPATGPTLWLNQAEHIDGAEIGTLRFLGSKLDELRLYSCEQGHDPQLPSRWNVNLDAFPDGVTAYARIMHYPERNAIEKNLKCDPFLFEPYLVDRGRSGPVSRKVESLAGGRGNPPMMLRFPDGTYGDSRYGMIAGLDQAVVVGGAGYALFTDFAAGVAGMMVGQVPGDSVEVLTSRYAAMPADTLPVGRSAIAAFMVWTTASPTGTQLVFYYGGQPVDAERLEAWRFDDSLRVFTKLSAAVDTAGHSVTITTDLLGTFLLAVGPATTTAADGLVPRTLSLRLRGNPVRSGARLQVDFAVPTRGTARLQLFGVTGALVASLFDGEVAAGPHAVTWDGRTRSGERVAAGVYFLSFDVGASRHTATVVVVP